jgi:hypothetical protein
VSWRSLIKPGDWLVLTLCAAFAGALLPVVLKAGGAERAVVKRAGQVVAELPLTAARSVEVSGPLGVTRIEIQPGRARVAADPGPRQYCVRQGWLTRPNAIAICAPNQVSLALLGRDPAYDSLNY